MVLHNPLDSSNVVRCASQDLTSDEIAAHLKAGKAVKSLGVSWNHVIHCIIDDDLSIKRLQFQAIEEEQSTCGRSHPGAEIRSGLCADDARADAFFESLFRAFGGLGEPKPFGRKNKEED